MLQIGYFQEDFKGAPTVLFAGDHRDIERLRAFFLSWDMQDVELIEALGREEGVYLHILSALRLECARTNALDVKNDKAVWRITENSKEQFIGLLDGLLDSDRAGHQYFDEGFDDIQIMIAKDEYTFALKEGNTV